MSKTILVIDDDDAVRSMISQDLTDCGYVVIEAQDGKEGLEKLQAHGVIDLVITDLIMPRKGGLEAIEDMRAVRPYIKIIAMSGGGRNKIGDFLKIAEGLGCQAVLQKPMDMFGLEDTVRQLLQ